MAFVAPVEQNNSDVQVTINDDWDDGVAVFLESDSDEQCVVYFREINGKRQLVIDKAALRDFNTTVVYEGLN